VGEGAQQAFLSTEKKERFFAESQNPSLLEETLKEKGPPVPPPPLVRGNGGGEKKALPNSGLQKPWWIRKKWFCGRMKAPPREKKKKWGRTFYVLGCKKTKGPRHKTNMGGVGGRGPVVNLREVRKEEAQGLFWPEKKKKGP